MVAERRTKASKDPDAAADEDQRSKRFRFIRDMACELFAELGYSATTMDQVSERTGLNKGTIYYYYRSKSEILFDICYATSLRTIELTAPPPGLTPLAAIEYIINVWAQMLAENRSFFKVYFQEEAYFQQIFSNEQNTQMRDCAHKFMRIHYGAMDGAIKAGVFRPMNTRYATRVLVSVLSGLHRWVDNLAEFDQVLAMSKQILFEGMCTPSGISALGDAPAPKLRKIAASPRVVRARERVKDRTAGE